MVLSSFQTEILWYRDVHYNMSKVQETIRTAKLQNYRVQQQMETKVLGALAKNQCLQNKVYPTEGKIIIQQG